MNNLKKNIKENKYIYLIMFFIIFSIFGFFAIDRFATDTYYFQAFGMANNAVDPYLHDGRLIMTLFLYVLDFFKFSCVIEKKLSWLLAITSLFLGSVIFYNIIKKHNKNKILNVLTSICLVVNPFVIEPFIFTEYTGVTCLGILFVYISIFYTVKFWEDKRGKSFLISLLFTLLSVMCYQGVLSLVFIIPVVLVLKYSPDFKTFVKNVFSSGIIFSIGALFTALLTKLLGASRLATKLDLIQKLKDIYHGVKNLLITTFNILPKNVLLILFVVTLIICFIFLKKKKENILHLILVLGTLFIVPALPHIFTDYVWMVPRSNIGYGTIAIVPILFYTLYSKGNKYANYSFILIMIALLVLQFQSSISFAAGQIKNDLYLTEETKKINNYIDKYEQENSIKVSKYKVYSDKNITYVYPNIKFGGDMNVRALSYDWAYNSIIKFKTGRELIDGKENEEFKAYCKNNDWQEFNEDELKIVNDTLYICVY